MFISKIFLWSDYFERTWVWSQPVASALQSDHKWLRTQLGLTITSSSALESDHSLIKVGAMVWIWVWTMVWRWSDQNAFGLNSLIRDPLCLASLIRGILGLEGLIRVNFHLQRLIRDNFCLESLIRLKFGSGPQRGLWSSILCDRLSCALACSIHEACVSYNYCERGHCQLNSVAINDNFALSGTEVNARCFYSGMYDSCHRKNPSLEVNNFLFTREP